MDISEYISYAAWLCACVLLVALRLNVKLIADRKYRALARILTGVSATTATLGLAMAVLMHFGMEETERMPALWAPDGGRVALQVRVLQGPLGTNLDSIQIRSKRMLSSISVYTATAAPNEKPQVAWADSRHLEIHYKPTHGYSGGADENFYCSRQGLDIAVACIPDLNVLERPSK